MYCSTRSIFRGVLVLVLGSLCWGSSALAAPPSSPNTPLTTAKVAVPLDDATRKERFHQANQLYNKGRYEKAIAQFKTLLEGGAWDNFSVQYNLGNCYYRLRNYGYALVYYRRAQRLRPNDVSLLHNIQLLQRQIKKNTSQLQSMRLKFLFWYYLMSLQQLFYLVVVATALGLLLWAIHIRRAFQGNRSLRWLVAGGLTLAFVFWASFGIKYYQERHIVTGVITKSKVTVRSGYGANFEALFLLTEADEVRIQERVEGWYRVEAQLYDTKTKRHIRRSGWLKQETLLPI